MTTIYTYTVVGVGRFPVDMLRYDGAWPLSARDAATIESSFTDPPSQRSVRLVTRRPPSAERWLSFLWAVDEEMTCGLTRVSREEIEK